MVIFLLSDDPYIYLLSSAYQGSGRGGSKLRRVFQTSSSPAILFSFSLGILRHSQAGLDIDLLQ